MTDTEYQEFMAFIFEKYVRPRGVRLRERFHHHMENEWQYHLYRAERATQWLRFLEAQCVSDEEVYETFKEHRLGRAVADTRESYNFANRAMEEAGFLDAYEANASAILSGLNPQHVPEVDRQLLREIGSPNPELELLELVYQAKELLHKREFMHQETSIRQELKNLEAQLERADRDFDALIKLTSETAESDRPSKPPRRKSRRWFKGLGQISQGAALSIANVALAVGALNFPVTPETRTWGAITSVVTGIGAILNGCGELRHE
jgi:hypothetical protein